MRALSEKQWLLRQSKLLPHATPLHTLHEEFVVRNASSRGITFKLA